MTNLLRNMPIRVKLLSYATVMLLLLCLSFGYAIYSLTSIGHELDIIVDEDIPLTQEVGKLTIAQLEQAIDFEKAMHYGTLMVYQAQQNKQSLKEKTQQSREKYNNAINRFNKHSEILITALKKAEKLTAHARQVSDANAAVKLAQIEKALFHIEEAHASYDDHARQTFDFFSQGKIDEAERLAALVEEEEHALDQETTSLLFELQEFTRKGAIIARAHEVSAVNTLIVFGIISLLAGILLSIVIGNFIVRGIKVAIETANGDLNKEITVNSRDEIGDLLAAMNAMKTKILYMLRDISSITADLSNSSVEMNSQTSYTSNVISKQKNETELVAAAINQMTATNKVVADAISETATSALKATELTSQGSVVIDTAVAQIDKLSAQINHAAQTINELNDHSKNIDSVMSVIEGIAEQTNLLALNAAIEAARAGEQGRGFAVVADEVRTLAVRTQASTKEINDMIQKLQNGTNSAVDLMQKSLEQTNRAVERTKESGQSFATISSEVQNISNMCEQISTSAAEQEAVSEEINRNILQISEMTANTEAGADKTSQTSSHLEGMAGQLKSIVAQYSQ
jgi:methyl-accepting chemotaxis protein